MTHIEEAIIERLRSGPCCFDDLVTGFPDVGWGELFVAVDCMSRDGRVSLLQIGYSTYQISLGSRRRDVLPLRLSGSTGGSNRAEANPTPGP